MEAPATMKGPLLQTSAGTAKPYAAPETTSTSDSASPYDMGLIPDSRVFFPPKRSSVAPTSRAERIPKIKGIYSHDPLLDNNPEELWRFLVSNLQAPRMAVGIMGTHTVTTTSGTGSNSSTSTTTVTDFSIQLDVSKYVNPQWSRIFTNPSRRASKDVVTPTVRETLEEYAGSKNAFKEFRLLKFVEWDFEELTKSLEELVRSTGYRSTVNITFPMQGYKVVALASNEFSKAANSKVVRVLCVVSCLFLVFWPVWAIARKRMKNRLVCAYGMGASGEVFYARNQRQIYNLVEQRFKQEFVTAF